jgi:hypothetical protein
MVLAAIRKRLAARKRYRPEQVIGMLRWRLAVPKYTLVCKAKMRDYRHREAFHRSGIRV